MPLLLAIFLSLWGLTEPARAAASIRVKIGGTTTTIPPSGSISVGTTLFGQNLMTPIRVFNDGNTNLNITGVSLPSGFVLGNNGLDPVIPPGANDNFGLILSATSGGVFSGTARIHHNATNTPSPFSFTVVGTVLAPAFRLQIGGTTTAVPHGGTISVGTTTEGQDRSLALRVFNDGTSDLHPSSVTMPTGFRMGNNGLNPVISPGQSDNFGLVLKGSTPGSFSGLVKIHHDAPNLPSPYQFTATGTVTAAPTNDAQFVSQQVPSVVRTGTRPQVSITFRNSGTIPWSSATNHRLGSAGPRDNLTWSINRMWLSGSEVISPGQNKTFTVPLVPPDAPGTYGFQWQMVQDLVEWFGGTSPNHPIRVEKNDAVFVSQSVPSLLRVGKTQQVSVTFRNTGTTTWTHSTYKLGSQAPQDNTTWGLGRVFLAPGESTAPGQQKTFTFNIKAPTTPGTYDFRWKMVEELVQWFGPKSPRVRIQVVRNKSAFVSQNVPTTLQTGETRQVSVTFKNTGTSTWTRGTNYRLGSSNPRSNNTWGLQRVQLSSSDAIAPLQQKTFTFNVTAPSTPGTYNFRWQMLREGDQWFGETSTNRSITVVGTPDITSLSPRNVSLNSVSTITLTGNHLRASDIYIPTSADSQRNAPTILSITELDDGRKLEIQLDTAGTTQGRWMVAVTNSTDTVTDAADFIVVPPGPYLEGFSPSQPIIGKKTTLLILGANLEGASVFCTNPAVLLSDVNTSNDEAITGILSVIGDTVPGSADLIISNHGVSVNLRMDLIPNPEPLRSSREQGSIYTQELHWLQPTGEAPPENRIGLCEFTFGRTIFAEEFVLAYSLRDSNGDSAPGILDSLVPGQPTDFGINLVVVAFQVRFSATFNFCGGFNLTTCLTGFAGVELLGIAGGMLSFSHCIPGGSFVQHQVVTPGQPDLSLESSNSSCVVPGSDVTIGAGELGEAWVSTVEMVECCPAEISLGIESPYIAFDGTNLPFIIPTVSLPLATATCRRPLVVLDPGHGTGGQACPAIPPTCTEATGCSSAGATGPTGLTEHTVALDIAGLTANALLAHGGVDVLLTRGAANVSLIDRINVANQNDADVFVSIHFDDVATCPRNRTQVIRHATNSNATSLALAQTMAPLLIGATGFANPDSGPRARNLIVTNLECHDDPDRAAVLAEVSFLCDPVEEQRLRAVAYRMGIAQAIADAILLHLGIP